MTLRATAEAVGRKLTAAHFQLLEVCSEFAKSSDGLLCGKWIKDACDRQGIFFHQGWLARLANVGLLTRDDSSRGGHRRYYRLTNPEIAQAVMDLAGSGSPT